MTSGPATVMELSERQTTLLRRSIQAKLQQLDTLSDETLVDYVLVLLANRHERGKIINELEDFLSPMVVETFVEWLFGEITRVREQPDRVAIPASKPASELVPAPAMIRSMGPLKKSPLFEAALKDIPRSGDSGDAQQRQLQEQQERKKRTERFGMVLDEGHSTATGHFSRRRDDERRSRSPRQRQEREGGGGQRRREGGRSSSLSPPAIGRRVVRMVRTERDDYNDANEHEAEEAEEWTRRESFESRSHRRPIRYKSISARQAEARAALYEDRRDRRVKVKDARELISSSARHSLRSRDERHTSQFGSDEDDEARPREYGNNIATGPTDSSYSPSNNNKRTRCTFWPHCKAGDACPYVHPSEPCKHFPSCVYGDKCLFIHPAVPCKFQDRCHNPTCNYMHHSPATGSRSIPPTVVTAFSTANNPYLPPSAITCRFYPNCKNPSCPFVHPTTVSCKFGESCQRPACPYSHPASRVLASRSMVNAPCRYGRNCAKSDCPFQHPQTSSMGDTGSGSGMEALQAATEPTMMMTSEMGMLDDAANRAVVEASSIMSVTQE